MSARRQASVIGRALVDLRWSRLSKEERSEQGKVAAAARLKGTTKAERSEMMRALVAKRWAKKHRRRAGAKRGGGR